MSMIKGTYTALITPFKEDEDIDWSSLERLIEFNIDNGISGLVPCGTTGESPTLTAEEHKKVIGFVVRKARGRVPVIAGTGSNCTREAVEFTREAGKDGADAVLVVSPYYNKPTQEGLYLHFRKVAESTGLPVIIYNIFGRTGVNIETSTLLRLIESCPNIRNGGVKEASGNMAQIKDVIAKVPKEFSVLSGDDGLTLDVIKEGGHGVISVASNIVPREVSSLTNNALRRIYSSAEKWDKYLGPLFKAAFLETNPIPIKYMLSFNGMCKEVYRLPLCEMGAENKKRVEKVMEDFNLMPYS